VHFVVGDHLFMATVAVYRDIDCKNNFSHLLFWHYFNPILTEGKSANTNMKISNAASPTRRVSAIRKGCGRARFWIRLVCSGNGHAYPGTLREGPAEKRVRVALGCHNSFGCLAVPFGF
jgi:hypothetical protein